MYTYQVQRTVHEIIGIRDRIWTVRRTKVK
jgi:hypothetical protein